MVLASEVLAGMHQKKDVQGIYVTNCTFIGTQNGVRVKTWPSAPAQLTVSDLHFEDLIMDNVSSPVIIDQEYCPHNLCKKIIKNVRGTTNSAEAVTLICSGLKPCENVEGPVTYDITKYGAKPGGDISQDMVSVGSLGGYASEKDVQGIYVTNCTFIGTQNGVRVKTWPSAPAQLTVSDLHFEDLIMDNVSSPVIIDQEYCPHNLCKKDRPSSIKITNVSIKNVRGTTNSAEAVTLILQWS
ncbi:Polygalacturonase [Sesamum angolense]|uniref:Polygalacturonase n=1 Tax=Sesamum angolense TaxID=2727404 RepID=A0AAE1XD67_9LAMI|nr:Polygalacturonase [Sesamum angolense]